MASRQIKDPEVKQTPRRPATTPEGRENQLVALAVERAEQQLKDGTASAQVITHYLKLGSTREKLEQERLAAENELLRVKVEAMASSKQVEALYRAALGAMRSYSGQDAVSEEYDDED